MCKCWNKVKEREADIKKLQINLKCHIEDIKDKLSAKSEQFSVSRKFATKFLKKWNVEQKLKSITHLNRESQAFSDFGAHEST